MRTKIKSILDFFCSFLSVNPTIYLRIATGIFVGMTTYNYFSTFGYHSSYIPTVEDNIWYLAEKIFTLLIYLVLLCYVKETPLRYEMLFVVIFSFIRIGWQVYEFIDYNSATNDNMQLSQCFSALILCILLISLWVGLYFFRPREERIT